MSADRVKWEHIHRVFELCNRNVSETARRLKMHRRDLQESYLKRSQDKLSLLKIVTKIANIETLNNSAGKKGNTPSAHNFFKRYKS